MKRACTATITLSVTGVNPSTCTEFKLYFTNGNASLDHNKTILIKTYDDFTNWTTSDTTYTGTCTLTQAETRKFTDKYFYTQVRAITADGVAVAGGISKFSVTDVLNDEILGG